MFPIRDHNPSYKLPIITILIILANIYVFFLEITSSDLERFVYQYALIPKTVNFFNPQSLIQFFSSMYLHAGWLHLISNMWFLWIFGDNIEGTFGHVSFFAFYTIFGLAAALLQYILDPTSSIPVLGASGAIAGVLGAYLVFFPKARIDTLVFSFIGLLHTITLPASFILIYWFIIQLFSGVSSLGIGSEGGVAWWAHIGGFGAGWLTAQFIKKPGYYS